MAQPNPNQLPSINQALDTVSAFNDRNPGDLSGYRELATALDGMSLAVASIYHQGQGRFVGRDHTLRHPVDPANDLKLESEFNPDSKDERAWSVLPEGQGFSGITRTVMIDHLSWHDRITIPNDVALRAIQNDSGLEGGARIAYYADGITCTTGGDRLFYPFSRSAESTLSRCSPQKAAIGYATTLQFLGGILCDSFAQRTQ